MNMSSFGKISQLPPHFLLMFKYNYQIFKI